MENMQIVKPYGNHILAPELVYKQPPFDSKLGGNYHLNSWHWIHVKHRIVQLHCWVVLDLLTTLAYGQAQIRRNQGGPSMPEGKRGIYQDCSWWRPDQIPQDGPSKTLICSPWSYPLFPPAQPRKNGNRPIIDANQGGTAHPPRIHGGVPHLWRVQGSIHSPQESTGVRFQGQLTITIGERGSLRSLDNGTPGWIRRK